MQVDLHAGRGGTLPSENGRDPNVTMARTHADSASRHMETAAVPDSVPGTQRRANRPLFDRWCIALSSAPAWQPPATPTVIVVPHPDDEVLVAGGLIRLQRNRNVPVRIVAVTDGEAAYDDELLDDNARRALSSRRRREQARSLELLGVGRGDTDRLGLPDGGVAAHASELEDWIASEYPGHLVIAPWSHDFHPDHEACGRAASAASLRSGSPLWYGFFWTWHRADPRLLADMGVLRHLRRIDLPKSVRSLRTAALEQHMSQLERLDGPPVLVPTLLEPTRWHSEYYLDASGIFAEPSTAQRSDPAGQASETQQATS